MRRLPCLLWAAATLLAAATLGAAEAPKPADPIKPGDVLLTIYSGDIIADEVEEKEKKQEEEQTGRRERHLAVVRECRTIDLPEGVSVYQFANVAERIEATTLRFVDLTDPLGTRILEQNYHYDLFDADELLKRFLDRPVEFVAKSGRKHTGRLLSRTGPLILRSERGGIEIVGYKRDDAYAIHLPEVPKDLTTRPTLAWTVRARKGGKHNVLVSYQADGISWRSDYAVVLSPDDSRMDLNAWVTLSNNSGARFPNARVKLIAGDVRRITSEPERVDRRRGFFDDPGRPGRELPIEKELFEYHLYSLPRATTLENRQTKQLELVAAADVAVKKVYTYDGVQTDRPWYWWWGDQGRRDETYGTRCRKTVRVNLEFDNTKAAGLGVPLPAGVLRAFKRDDADGSLELIGEDRLDHMPRGETVRLHLGDAFDIVGERVRTDFHRDYRELDESFKIELRNHKKAPITVEVLEHLYRWRNWKIQKHSMPFAKLDSQSIGFTVPIPANDNATVTYTVHYWW